MITLQQINAKIDNQEFNYYGIMSITIVAGTCLASIALMYMLMNHAAMWQLVLLSSIAMGSNATAISHSPLKWVIWSFAANVSISLLLLIANLL